MACLSCGLCKSGCVHSPAACQYRRWIPLFSERVAVLSQVCDKVLHLQPACAIEYPEQTKFLTNLCGGMRS